MEQKSKPRRRRTRPRRRVNWGPTLALLLFANCVFAAYSSKITSIRAINLDGVRKSERLRLERLTEEIKGIPALKIDPRKVESSFMNETRVKKADFRRNIFGIARLILEYRTPVASFAGSRQTFLDESGVVYWDLEEKGVYPQISLETKIKVSVMAISGVINYASVAELAELVSEKLKDASTTGKPIEIEVQETGGVCLNINNGTVILGTSEELPTKIEKLKQVLTEHPDLFEKNSSVNLMVPERPQVIPRKKENG